MDTPIFIDTDIAVEDVQNTGIDLSLLTDEINTANLHNTSETTLEKTYLYHIYNISPSHIEFFNSKYSEHIIGWILHSADPNEDRRLQTSGTVRNKDGLIAEILTCPSKTHIHVVIQLPRVRSDYISTGQADGKWFGFETYKSGTFQMHDGSYLSRQQLWRQQFPTQEPYACSLIASEQHYINTIRYLKTRHEKSNKGSLGKLLQITPDKYLYSGLDKRKKNSLIENTAGASYTDNESDSSVHSTILVRTELLEHKQKIFEEAIEVDYQMYKVHFLDKGYSTIAEWQQGKRTMASDEIKTIFTKGKQAEKNLRAKPMTDDEIHELCIKYPLMTKLIKLILFHIVMKRVEKDIFLILQGPPSCGKSSISVAIADAYPNSYECVSMEAFLHRDSLGMESIATKHCESIICDEFGFVDREGRGHKQVQDYLKQYLSGKEITVRVRKNTKEILNDSTRIKLIIATCNSDRKRVDDVHSFLQDKAVLERTIRIQYKSSFFDEFKDARVPTNQIPFTDLSRYAITIRIQFEAYTQKVDAERIQKIFNLIQDSWYLHDKVEISYNSLHSTNILGRLKDMFQLSTPPNITDYIPEINTEYQEVFT